MARTSASGKVRVHPRASDRKETEMIRNAMVRVSKRRLIKRAKTKALKILIPTPRDVNEMLGVIAGFNNY